MNILVKFSSKVNTAYIYNCAVYVQIFDRRKFHGFKLLVFHECLSQFFTLIDGGNFTKVLSSGICMCKKLKGSYT